MVHVIGVRHVQRLHQQRLGVGGGGDLLEVPLHHQRLEVEGVAGPGHAEQPGQPVEKQNPNLRKKKFEGKYEVVNSRLIFFL